MLLVKMRPGYSLCSGGQAGGPLTYPLCVTEVWVTMAPQKLLTRVFCLLCSVLCSFCLLL